MKLINIKKLNIIFIIIVITYLFGMFFKTYGSVYNKTNIHANIVGPSYAYNFIEYEGDKDYKLFLFPTIEKGITDELNKKVLAESLDSQDTDYNLLSIGVNDHSRNIDISDFERIITDYVNEAKNKKKIIFIHSYMEYPISKFPVFKYKVSDYDNVFRKICNSNANAIYIDMSMYNEDKYHHEDGMHYTKSWYDILVQKLEYYISVCDNVIGQTQSAIIIDKNKKHNKTKVLQLNSDIYKVSLGSEVHFNYNYWQNDFNLINNKKGFVYKNCTCIIDIIDSFSGIYSSSTYYFDEEGKLYTGWAIDKNGDYYYFDKNNNANKGRLLVGWQNIDGEWYCFMQDGKLYVNTITPDGYIVSNEGILLKHFDYIP